ncbi:hypothetical protein REPUB_Repub18cG0097400 [Reevesia pubescens]
MPRPWTGRAPLPPSKKKMKGFDSFVLPPPNKKGVKPIQKPGPYLPGTGPSHNDVETCYTHAYPRLIPHVPEGLTLEEATEVRKKGRKLMPTRKLAKNGVYVDLVKNVREAFEECELVRIKGSNYRKNGAKLKELVPCVLISIEDEHILIWRGRNWKSSFPKTAFNSGGEKIKAASATSITEQLEGQELSPAYVQTASKCSPLISAQDISIEQRLDKCSSRCKASYSGDY